MAVKLIIGEGGNGMGVDNAINIRAILETLGAIAHHASNIFVDGEGVCRVAMRVSGPSKDQADSETDPQDELERAKRELLLKVHSLFGGYTFTVRAHSSRKLACFHAARLEDGSIAVFYLNRTRYLNPPWDGIETRLSKAEQDPPTEPVRPACVQQAA